MKFYLILVIALAACNAADLVTEQAEEQEAERVLVLAPARSPDPGLRVLPLRVSEEGIFQNFGKLALKGLKEIGLTVGRDLIGKAAEILTDGLRINPTPEVQQALNSGPSTEGIFNATASLIIQRATDLAAAQAEQGGPSHEGILANFGPFYRINDAQRYLSYQYNQTIHGDSPSHEGILGSLGGLIFKGLGGLIGGNAGNIIQGAGNILGNLFYAIPGQLASQEGIIDRLGNSGILTSSGQLVIQGAAKAAKSLLRGLFKPYGDLLKNSLFLYRGNFNGYPDIQAPGKEALLTARAQIHQHPEAQQCIDAAERNLTQLFDQYVKNGHACLAAGQNNGQRILAQVFDIITDSVKRVEDAHREAGNCFKRQVDENKVACLDQEVPAQIEEHRERFLHYGQDLNNYVREFSDLNTQFDVCLTGHLGEVRREVYHIIYDFHQCVELDHQNDANRKKSILI